MKIIERLTKMRGLSGVVTVAIIFLGPRATLAHQCGAPRNSVECFQPTGVISPGILLSRDNAVPNCVTPPRLSAFVKSTYDRKFEEMGRFHIAKTKRDEELQAWFLRIARAYESIGTEPSIAI